MELTIHTTKQQVLLLMQVFGKPIHASEEQGGIAWDVPHWLEVMWDNSHEEDESQRALRQAREHSARWVQYIQEYNRESFN